MNEKTYYPTRCEVINEIISSVADEQTSLARILEVEAEKIKAVISTTKNTKDLLDTNRSVQNMINAVTRLELILSSKIDLFQDCLCVGCTNQEQGYSITDIIVETENGGRIVKGSSQTEFGYYHGTTDAVLKIITEPETQVILKSELPTNWKYENNRLYIPLITDWTRSYYMTFTVGTGDTTYDITLTTYV